MIAGEGFIVTLDEAKHLGLGTVPGLDAHIRPFRNGRDLTAGGGVIKTESRAG